MSSYTHQSKGYYLNRDGHFVLENYQNKKNFASFLPGIAGEDGIPLWVFYVNRGQGVASFGATDKDHAIMEFYPANKSYQNVQTKGFRTFIKLGGAEGPTIYEPFRYLREGVTTKMIISLSTLTLEETATDVGLRTRVHYFILPGESFGALVRRVSIQNLQNSPQTLEVLDGMPIIIPYGMSNQALKEISQTVSAWSKVYGVEEKTAFYRMDASFEDRTEVKRVEAGHFFISLSQEEAGNRLLSPLVDPEVIFAEESGLEKPLGFLRRELAEFSGVQMKENKFPSAMAALRKTLDSGEELTIFSVYGFLPNAQRLAAVQRKVTAQGYLEDRQTAAEELHKYYADRIFTVSNDQLFTYYTRQTFIDNFLRGGFPINLGQSGEEVPYYVFSRKHGDLERDYNQFHLAPTFYSHGNGNFRDVLQNRRSDNFFNSKLKTENIKSFASLLQPDGYNPLVIEGNTYYLAEEGAKEELLQEVAEEDRAKLKEVLAAPFTPGEIAMFITEQGVRLRLALPSFLGLLMKKAASWTEAKFGEGFWIDHWTYLLDLIETYLGLYPEELTSLLFVERSYTFFDSYVKVQPRRKKYVLTEAGPRQGGALLVDEDKKQLIAKRRVFPYAVRTGKGRGEIYRTNLFVILFTLILNKLSALDPHGVGIEMEANKPGWYDALNGLPGLFGSSTPETMELLRLVRFMLDSLNRCYEDLSVQDIDYTVATPTEVYQFYQGLDGLLREWMTAKTSRSTAVQQYWKSATALRETYREEVFYGFTGTEKELSLSELAAFLQRAVLKLEAAVEGAKNRQTGIFDTYYTNLPIKYAKTGEVSPDGLPYIEVTEFGRHVLPAFLEGQVRGMKILSTREEALALHNKVCGSNLYDQALGMYRVNEDLSSESFEIGRARAFTPGWLENGSIWLHMEYKYLLELLKAGLYDQFYTAAKTALVPYLDPEVYGRSPLENSSFILSSLNKDHSNHGRGYIARLSGSTAEFLSIWSFLSFGSQPFPLKDREPVYAPQPVLQGELFTEEPRRVEMQTSLTRSKLVEVPANAYAYRFLGDTLVVYLNPKRGHTYGPGKVSIQGFRLLTAQGEEIKVDGREVPTPLAKQIRAGKIKRIEAFFA